MIVVQLQPRQSERPFDLLHANANAHPWTSSRAARALAAGSWDFNISGGFFRLGCSRRKNWFGSCGKLLPIPIATAKVAKDSRQP